MSKEALAQAFRGCIGVLVKEETELVEGEAVEIQTNSSLTGATNTRKLTNDIETIYSKTTDVLSKEQVLALPSTRRLAKSPNSVPYLHGREIMILLALMWFLYLQRDLQTD
ncbi:hypothetical protein EV421DRAFT_1844326 [Armillaria borealis]|uniref:TIP49 P-loop domain-containing protein n=1 Tax=Armillaria borealis TaxID=47425 RepID=A0AA39IZW9_9AGAR|nr:hypothetical protein EV421DRAFT_1844326 [Armillaria borealis]